VNAEALDRYRELPLPDTTQEHWRFTDLRGFDPAAFAARPRSGPVEGVGGNREVPPVLLRAGCAACNREKGARGGNRVSPAFPDGEPSGGGPVPSLHVRAGGRRGHPVASSHADVRML